jgi:hypothetical protein
VKQNPFEVLRLDPATPLADIVRHAGRLRQQAGDEATLNAIRQAVQALTGDARERLLHEILTHPRPQYRWPTLEPFILQRRRSPAPAVEPEEKAAHDRAAQMLDSAWRSFLFSP